ncbi:Cytosine deaminase [compost metagenome]
MLGYRNLQNALDLVTVNSARAMALGERYGLEPGRPANLLILSAENDYEVIRSQGLPLYSVRGGQVLMKRTMPVVELAGGQV